MITTVMSIYLMVYISSLIYYQIEFFKAVYSNFDYEFGANIRGVLESIFFFILGFVPVLNTLFAYKLFTTRNI